MSVSIIVHVANEDPMVCEVEKLPEPTHQIIVVNNPRKRDGTDFHYIDEGVSSLILPWHRINFIQILPTGEEDDIIGFVRE